MVSKDEITFDVRDGMGINGSDTLENICFSYYLGENNEYGDCYLTITDDTNEVEITTIDDITNYHQWEELAIDEINNSIREKISDYINDYLER